MIQLKPCVAFTRVSGVSKSPKLVNQKFVVRLSAARDFLIAHIGMGTLFMLIFMIVTGYRRLVDRVRPVRC